MDLPTELSAMVPYLLDFLDFDGDEMFAAASVMLNACNTCITEDRGHFEGLFKSPHLSQSSNPDFCQANSFTENRSKETPLSLHASLSQTDGHCEFIKKFRMQKSIFKTILSVLNTHSKGEINEKRENEHSGCLNLNDKVDVSCNFKKDLLVTLYYLGSHKSVKAISEAFQTSEDEVLESIKSGVNSLFGTVDRFISWPQCERDVKTINDGFEKLSRLSGVMGAVQSTHVEFDGDCIDDSTRQFYMKSESATKPSVILQVVCDHQMRFIHSCAGWPGTLDTSSVLHQSDLFTNIIEKKSDYFPQHSFLIGDRGYPLYRWMITPFICKEDGKLQDFESQFNLSHSLASNVCSKALLRLRRRFPRLECLGQMDVEFLVKTILVMCAIHNVCIEQENGFDLDGVFKEHTSMDPITTSQSNFISCEINRQLVTSASADGLLRRETIAKKLFVSR